ncbi:hypothetical protein [Microbacterium sp. XT11]|uniref:hypothetical protein n=1 Tax=Microbacterium sp. XT11 TaxID=367477 RepID=UPI00082C2C09|nr:hypothetical protein [Microbacterium sp. XT11]
MTATPPHDDRSDEVGLEPVEATTVHGIGDPDEPSESSDPNGEWWIDGPIFSTAHSGSSITSLRPGARPGRFTASMIARLSFAFLFWIGFAFLALPRIVDPIAAPAVEALATQWWWYVVVVLAVISMVVLGPTFGFTRRATAQYGQLGLPAVAAALVITAAVFIALLLHLAIGIDYIRHAPPTVEYWELPDTGILLIFLAVAGVGALGLLVALPFSIRFAVKTQRTIVAIRRTGTRYAGRLEHLDFRHRRISHLSQFSVRVSFGTPDAPRVVTAQMQADPERVPLVGEPLLVIVSTIPGRRGSREQILIEPDPDRPMRFDPDSGKYVVTADGGGG